MNSNRLIINKFLKEIRTRVVPVQETNRHDAQRVRDENHRASRRHKLHEKTIKTKRHGIGELA